MKATKESPVPLAAAMISPAAPLGIPIFSRSVRSAAASSQCSCNNVCVADPFCNSLYNSSLSCDCCKCANGCAPVGQAMSGFIRAGYLDTQLPCRCASIVAVHVANCHHTCFCNATSPDCDLSQSVRQVDISAQHYLVMPCRPAQSKSTKTTRSTSLPSTTCPIILGNRTLPCTVGCLCPSSCTVACC